MTPSAADSPVDLIISACTVLVHDDQERIGFAGTTTSEGRRIRQYDT
ncbi:hypothetical protein QFZ55_002091 [Streptomyces luteogriseus]|nr:hypothetical protein [Streptomyces luteogriseus]MDQ0712639.1 hypothetical protein [Streptomyces luteogriseus]